MGKGGSVSRTLLRSAFALAQILALLALVVWARADECNPNLVSNRTPKCMLYQPQYRQCRPDEDLNKDMDILDFLCQQCPPGQCISGFDPSTAAPTCVPCGCNQGGCNLDCQNGGFCALVGGVPTCICPPEFCGGLCQQMCSPTTTTAAPTTTSSSTSATTSTTSAVTTSTTSTTQPVVGSTSFMAIPSYGTSEASIPFPTHDNDDGQNHGTCVRFVAPYSINGVSRLVAYNTVSPGLFSSERVAIFPDDDNANPLGGADGGGNLVGAWSANTNQTFNLVKGTIYRECFCATSYAGNYAGPAWQSPTGFAGEQNTFVISVGQSGPTQFCNGTMATRTTGALTADATRRPMLVLLSAE